MSQHSVYPSKRHLWASILLATIGLLYYQVMPLYLGSLQDHSDIGTAEIGFIGSAYFLGLNLCSASSYFWIRSIPPRQFSLFAMLLLMGLLWATTLDVSAALLIAMMFLLGVVSGAVTSVGVTIAGDDEAPAKWYGIQVASEAAAGVLLLLLMPLTLMATFGFPGLIYGMLIMIATLALPSTLLLPSHRLEAIEDQSASEQNAARPGVDASLPAAWMTLVALVFLFIGSASIWAFIERIATLNEYPTETVGLVLGITLFFAVVGPLAISAIGGKIGSTGSYLVSGVLLVFGVACVAVFEDIFLFTAGACCFMFGWAGGFSVLFALTAEVDPDGRHITLTVPALGIGSMIGPALAGKLLEASGTGPLLSMSVGTVAISMVLVLIARWIRR